MEIDKKYMLMNLALVIGAVLNLYLKSKGVEREVTADEIMAALAIGAPLANKFWHYVEVKWPGGSSPK